MGALLLTLSGSDAALSQKQGGVLRMYSPVMGVFNRCWLGQGGLVAEELQVPGLVSGGQPLQEQTAEQA